MDEAFPNDMLEYLVCPETQQRLKPGEAGLLTQLQARQQAGQLTDRSGNPITEPLQQVLVREDGKFAYAISDGFPSMLIDEAIPLDQLAH